MLNPHSHLHTVLGVTVDRGKVLVWSLFLVFAGYAFNSLTLIVLGKYSEDTRFAVYVLAALIVFVSGYFVLHHMQSAWKWLGDLEERERNSSPDGCCTRTLLWGSQRRGRQFELLSTTASPQPASSNSDHSVSIIAIADDDKQQQQQLRAKAKSSSTAAAAAASVTRSPIQIMPPPPQQQLLYGYP